MQRWITASLAVTLGAALSAQGLPQYYRSVDVSTPASLRATLHAVIDDHVEFPYSSSSAIDTWDILEDAQQDPSNVANILDLYGNRSYLKQGGGNTLYNREHTWPRSLGFPQSLPYGPFTDCHALWLCDIGLNAARANHVFGPCLSSHLEWVTARNNGTGGGVGVFPGNSNWSTGTQSPGTWQVWRSRKGDVARSLFYMDLRYEGGVHGVTNNSEPDLRLTDSRSLIQSSSTGQNVPVAYMGLRSELLRWHLDDPPDAFERRRNDVVSAYQQNRNPFVDHPEWVSIVYDQPLPGLAMPYGAGCGAGGAAAPVIQVSQPPVIGQPIAVIMAGARPNTVVDLYVGYTSAAVDLGRFGFAGCTLLAAGDATFPAMSSASGDAAIGFVIPNNNVFVGMELFCQWIGGIPTGSISTTGGMALTIGR